MLGPSFRALWRPRSHEAIDVRADAVVVRGRGAFGSRPTTVPLHDIDRVDVVPLTSPEPGPTLVLVTATESMALTVERPVWYQLQIWEAVRRAGLAADWGPARASGKADKTVLRLARPDPAPVRRRPVVEAPVEVEPAVVRVALRIDFDNGRSADICLSGACPDPVLRALHGALGAGPADASGDGAGRSRSATPQVSVRRAW